jgi:MFS family permease
MIVTGLIEMLAFFVLSTSFSNLGIYITKIPRKNGLILFYLVMILLGMLFFINPLRNNRIVAFVILGVIRFFGSKISSYLALAYTIVIMLLTESFPLSVQAMCAGIIEAIAQLGAFLAPIVITFCINLQIYPVIVLSFIAIVFVLIPLFFIKETRSQADVLKDSLIEKDSLAVDNN